MEVCRSDGVPRPPKPCPCGDAGAWLIDPASPPDEWPPWLERPRLGEPHVYGEEISNEVPAARIERPADRQRPSCAADGRCTGRPRRHPRVPAHRHARLPARARRDPEEVQPPAQHQAQGRVVQDHARPAAAVRELLPRAAPSHAVPQPRPEATRQPPHRGDGGALGRAWPGHRDDPQLPEFPAQLRRLDRQARHGARAAVLRRQPNRRTRIAARSPRSTTAGPRRTSTSTPRSPRSRRSTPGWGCSWSCAPGSACAPRRRGTSARTAR